MTFDEIFNVVLLNEVFMKNRCFKKVLKSDKNSVFFSEILVIFVISDENLSCKSQTCKTVFFKSHQKVLILTKNV